ncbi:MFS transporter [Paenibacillus wynnii]|uniref:Major facilitator superfamily (MFS) profile domain-containing protein n=1 Tax=Paenibacillus wynnii TaxID=268407 RepID=A0A098M6D6_9BACL|nr:MFS transporter [Paenibacillus wynnii]KGE17102.1 hypothetical protein PWYN_20855 [Paenibacillus wynnii]
MEKQNVNVKTFWIMVVGQFISLFGNSLLRYSLSLYILDITGSATIYSILMALTVVPQIFIAPYGGALADRASKKLIMIALDVIAGCMLLAYGFFMMHYDVSVIGVGIFICVMAIIQNIYDPTVRATVPIIVEPENLARANSITQVISTVSLLLGPLAAGFVYGLYGIRFVLLLDGVSFLAAALIEMFLVIPYQKREWTGNPLVVFSKELVETFRYVNREQKILLYIAYISAGLNFLIMPLYLIGIPFLEKEVFHVTNAMYGISEACIGAGVIIGALIVGIWGKALSIEKFHYLFVILAVVIFGMGCSTLTFVIQKDGVSYLAYFMLTITGFFFTAFSTISSIVAITFIQKASPKTQIGKIMSLINAFSTMFLPFGQVLLGWLYEVIGNNYIYLYVGVALITLVESRIIRKIIKEAKVNSNTSFEMSL